eukprot:1682114-Rhodomonas_salina.1
MQVSFHPPSLLHPRLVCPALSSVCAWEAIDVGRYAELAMDSEQRILDLKRQVCLAPNHDDASGPLHNSDISRASELEPCSKVPPGWTGGCER